jgi:hypothetical protein
MCVYVIYKCPSWDSDHQQDLGKPSLKMAKPSHHWEVVRCPISHGELEGSVCFERGVRMDSFTAVLTLLSYLLKYMTKVICVKKRTLCLMSNDHNNCEYMCDWSHFFICRLKINHKTCLSICVCSWDRHHCEQKGDGKLHLFCDSP